MDIDLVERQLWVLQEHVAGPKAKRQENETHVTIPLNPNNDQVLNEMPKKPNQDSDSNGGNGSNMGEDRSNISGKIKNKCWRGLFLKVNTLAKRRSKLDFILPIITERVHIVRLESEEAHKMAGDWDRLIVIFITGTKPLLLHVQRYVKAQWP